MLLVKDQVGVRLLSGRSATDLKYSMDLVVFVEDWDHRARGTLCTRRTGSVRAANTEIYLAHDLHMSSAPRSLAQEPRFTTSNEVMLCMVA